MMELVHMETHLDENLLICSFLTACWTLAGLNAHV
jgi:hypothetical protein